MQVESCRGAQAHKHTLTAKLGALRAIKVLLRGDGGKVKDTAPHKPLQPVNPSQDTTPCSSYTYKAAQSPPAACLPLCQDSNLSWLPCALPTAGQRYACLGMSPSLARQRSPMSCLLLVLSTALGACRRTQNWKGVLSLLLSLLTDGTFTIKLDEFFTCCIRDRMSRKSVADRWVWDWLTTSRHLN